MYEQFYGLSEKPFSLTPDPEFLFVNSDFRDALERIIYGIKRREGFTVIVGDVGTGKTTLCWALLGRLGENIRTALILNPLLAEEDLIKAVLQDFGIKKPRKQISSDEIIEVESSDPDWIHKMSRKELIDQLNYFLLEGAAQGISNILIIDESQNLSLGALEQLRILSNLETPKSKLLQIIFVGQLEFDQKLSLPQLRQLNQRITIRYELRPLSKADANEYILHRLKIAGSSRMVTFTKGALRSIYRFSAGYPRLLNVICDRALLAGFSERSRFITGKMVRKAARGLRSRAKSTKTRFVVPMRVYLPVAAMVAVMALAIVLMWPHRGNMAQIVRNFMDTSFRTQAVKTMSEPIRGTVTEDVLPAPKVSTSGEKEMPASDPEPISIPEPEPDSRPADSYDYIVQVHSLRSRQQADAAVSDLRNKGFPTFLSFQNGRGTDDWFVVFVGPYADLSSAREQASILRGRESRLPIIRRRESVQY